MAHAEERCRIGGISGWFVFIESLQGICSVFTFCFIIQVPMEGKRSRTTESQLPDPSFAQLPRAFPMRLESCGKAGRPASTGGALLAACAMGVPIESATRGRCSRLVVAFPNHQFETRRDLNGRKPKTVCRSHARSAAHVGSATITTPFAITRLRPSGPGGMAPESNAGAFLVLGIQNLNFFVYCLSSALLNWSIAVFHRTVHEPQVPKKP